MRLQSQRWAVADIAGQEISPAKVILPDSDDLVLEVGGGGSKGIRSNQQGTQLFLVGAGGAQLLLSGVVQVFGDLLTRHGFRPLTVPLYTAAHVLTADERVVVFRNTTGVLFNATLPANPEDGQKHHILSESTSTDTVRVTAPDTFVGNDQDISPGRGLLASWTGAQWILEATLL